MTDIQRERGKDDVLSPLMLGLIAGRRWGGRIRRHLFPQREVAAWRALCKVAWRTPRYQQGTIRLLDYDLAYADLLSVVPQWEDVFVRETHAFTTTEKSPRIIDCGANIGIVTLYLKRAYPSARIIAFEADPVIAGVLERNMKTNRATDVEVRQAAVWDENGETAFAAEGADSGSLSEEYRGRATSEIIVPTVRLRDVLAEETTVDLLKLDIEGAEHRVLADCEQELGKVRCMELELHELTPGSRRVPATLALIARAGFSYAHAETIPVPGRDAAFSAMPPFPRCHPAWVERVYAWRE